MDMAEAELFPCGASLDNLRCGCACASATKNRPHGWNAVSCSIGARSGGRELEREFRFHAERKWRADFAHIESRTLIEIEGGLWIQGCDNRPQGFAADAQKYLEAALAGWRVLRLTELQITAPTVERIITFIRTAGVKSV